jgi:hypothetical protein
MKPISLLNIAAIVITLMVLIIAYILVPEAHWTTVAVLAAVGFAGSAGFSLYVPSILRQRSETDAPQIAAIGPLAVIGTLLMLSMGASFALALAGYEKWGWATLALGIGLFVAAYLTMSAALKVIESVSDKGAVISHHVDWQGEAASLASMAVHPDSLAKLRALSEKLRYSPSDVPGGSPQDTAINDALGRMSAQLQTDPATDLTGQFGALDSLLAQRDVYLRSARGKA